MYYSKHDYKMLLTAWWWEEILAAALQNKQLIQSPKHIINWLLGAAIFSSVGPFCWRQMRVIVTKYLNWKDPSHPISEALKFAGTQKVLTSSTTAAKRQIMHFKINIYIMSYYMSCTAIYITLSTPDSFF